jgi:hypothetical protein
MTGGGQLVYISKPGYVGSDASQYLVAGFESEVVMFKVCIRAFVPSRVNSDDLIDPQTELIQQASDFHTAK